MLHLLDHRYFTSSQIIVKTKIVPFIRLYVSNFTTYLVDLRTLLTSILLFITYCGQGQTQYGLVVNGETAKPMAAVGIINMATQRSAVTDSQGNYSLTAKDDDMLSYSFPGFHTITRLAIPGTYLLVELLPLNVALKEYVLHPNYTQFQRDSFEMATTYSKELNTQKIKPGFSNANGGGFTGLIGGPVQKMSKSYKQNKKFKEAFRKDMEQKYIDTRYKPELVSAITGFSGDTLAIFMNTYPMPYDFARNATDLELKMWIRDNYKAYKPQPLDHLSIDPAKK